MAKKSQTRPFPLCSRSIKYFLGIDREVYRNSMREIARSHAINEPGSVAGTGLISLVINAVYVAAQIGRPGDRAVNRQLPTQ